jgi:hypothetical protein
MVTGLFGTPMSHNDVGVRNMWGLTCYLEQILHPDHIMAGGLLLALYGDSSFINVQSTVLCGYDKVGTPAEWRLIRKSNFQSIEHMYRQMFNLF